MLIGFQIENFRSFKERQVFSMEAGHFAEHAESNSFDVGLKGMPHLLRSAVVYGPNAAGKTNLLRAVRFMQEFVVNSAASAAAQFPFSPFKLSSAAPKETERVPDLVCPG